MQVKEVMTRSVACTSPGASLQEAAAKMKSLDVGVLPVCGNDDRLAGMITDRDIAIRAVAEGWDANRRVGDILSEGITWCFEDQDVEEAARTMREKQIRRLAVLNRDKRFVGMVSLGDLATETGDEHLAGRTLERVSETAGAR